MARNRAERPSRLSNGPHKLSFDAQRRRANRISNSIFPFGAGPSDASKDEGKIQPVYNYEQIGLNISKVGLSQNTPTLIGTLNLPGTSGTIFLVMTVRAAD
ncbi:MAG: hypothetical protein IPK98_01175 [Chloracidobacterium sp.]|nr:hypothetical protein [Chloracidobacterium sp.]